MLLIHFLYILSPPESEHTVTWKKTPMVANASLATHTSPEIKIQNNTITGCLQTRLSMTACLIGILNFTLMVFS
jgi:hypothetical protein